jgi:hypothetical protein
MSPGRIGLFGCLAACVVLAAAAHGPLFGAGLSAPDLRVLADASAAADARGLKALARALHGISGMEGHALAGFSVLVSKALWLRDGAWDEAEVWPLRAQNLVLLVVAAVAAGAFARRVLHPWIGRESARAAGLASALLVPLAPTSVAAVARLSARGDLLALALGCSAGALLMRARQERQPALGVVAGFLTILAGACSELALGLPLVFAAAEFASARRWRKERVRWRTAFITLVAFGACVSVQVLLRAALEDRLRIFGGPRTPALGYGEGFAVHAERSLERLGVLLLPASSEVWGGLGYALAATALFLALQPALRAARAAPRLWGWLAFAWLGAIALSELLSTPYRVTHADLSRSDALLGTALVTAVGAACCATAVSGKRRLLLPLSIAALWTVLGHGSARAWRAALQEVSWLRADLELAQAEHADAQLFAVLDPPGPTRGVDAVQGDLSALLEPHALGSDGTRKAPNVRRLSTGAFLALAREVELAELREAGLVVCFPRAAIGAEGEGRLSVLLPVPQPSGRTRSWQQVGRSPSDLDLEALGERGLRVRATAEAETQHAPLAYWRAESPLELLATGEIAGVWRVRGAGTETPVAVFDLSSSLAWVLAGRVRQIYPPEGGGWPRIEEAELLAELPPRPAPDVEQPIAPEVAGDDWRFAPPPGGFARDPEGRESWSLGLLDLETWEHAEIPAVLAANGELSAAGAARVVAEWEHGARSAVAWTLEGRVEGIAVWRARGRTQPLEDR